MEKKTTQSEFESLALEFYEKQRKFKNIEKKFKELKDEFSKEAEKFFRKKGVSKINIDKLREQSISINMVQKASVDFDVDKLEKSLGELSKDVIDKRYEIIDMPGLAKYLKSCGVNPKVFKSFLLVSKTVNTKKLDDLEERGEVSLEQIKNCYTLTQHNPYFTFKVNKKENE